MEICLITLLLTKTRYEFESCHFETGLVQIALGYLDLGIGSPAGLLSTNA